jgi:hypothetical protein
MIASGVGSAGSSAAGLRSSTRLHEVFVSYSSRDKPVADAIVARLEQAGIRCWVAPRDVLPGMNWAHAIVEAIGSTRLMVVVLSGEANRSPQVLREVERAIATGAVVIPFRVEAVEPTDAMAYYLASEHWLDALTPPLDDHITTLAQVVEAFLERAPEPATTAGSAAPDLDPLDRVYPASSPVTPTARGHRRGWLLVAGGILAVAGIVGAAVMLTTRTAPEPTGATATSGEPAASGDTLEPPHDATTNPPDPETSATEMVKLLSELEAGDCLRTPAVHAVSAGTHRRFWDQTPISDDTRFTVVECGQPHGAEVIALGRPWDAAADWPSDQLVSDTAWDTCEQAFEAYVGTPWSRAPVELVALRPSRETWQAEGDRSVWCFAFSPSSVDGLSASLRGDPG